MPDQPNILFILNDHQTYYGHGLKACGPKIKRPSFEKLASEGIMFNRAYTACPLCAPARRTMLTGLFPHDHGELTNNSFYPFDRQTYFEKLKERGYNNYYYGKWHSGPGTAYDHHCEGYSYPDYGNPYLTAEYENYLKENDLPPFEVRIKHSFLNPEWPITKEKGLIAGRLHRPSGKLLSEHAAGLMTTPKESHEAFFLANLACNKLRELANKKNDHPFHLRVDFWGPHQPYYITKEFYNLYNPKDIPEYPNFNDDLKNKPEIYKYDINYPTASGGKLIYPNPLPWSIWQDVLAFHYGHISMVDQAGGLILKTLEETGLRENTIVIWVTDHGDGVACHGGHFDKDCYMPEEMVRIPMAIRFPGEIEEGIESNQLVSNLDIGPTILDAARTSFDNEVDGMSLLPLCRQEENQWREDLMVETHGHVHIHLGRLVIHDHYKYIYNERDMDEFYDIEKDPFELNNLINDPSFKAKIADMKKRLNKWRNKTGDRMTRKNIRKSTLNRIK